MSILTRLLRQRGDDRAFVRPLWQRIVAVARDPRWYAEDAIADTVAGRFDAITLVLAVVLIRLERDPATREASARLTELFVTDMDGQLRESGIGDLVVGKHVGRLIGVLGGRLGSYRDALAAADPERLVEAVGRNVTLLAGASPAAVTARALALATALAASSTKQVLAGEFA
ncbi:MAG: hypothetical protein JF593_08130 [Novosphingobium sp.]|nr:hypothetical protein [Novosphingobium sp.]